MTDRAMIDRFTDAYSQLKPEDQEFMARMLEGLDARVKRDPEADGMPPFDLFREVVQEVAPERLGYFDRLAAARTA